MSCFHPLLALPEYVKENGKIKYKITGMSSSLADLVQSRKEWSYDAVDKSTGELLSYKLIPCGQCVGCRMDYSRLWANRCMMELQYHDEAYFLTLTYDDEHVPRNYFFEEGQDLQSLTLRPKDLQDFVKRVRSDQKYHFGESNLRFYACGEYGSQTQRPHYHMIAYSLHLDDLDVHGKSNTGFQFYRSEKLEKIWSHGLVGIAPVTWETCAYVARYILKKQSGANKSIYDKLHIEPEFVRMSRRPGIASRYYDDHKDKIYEYDVINLSTEQRGIKFKPPRYFDEKYDIEYPDQMNLIKSNREKVASALLEAKLADFSGSYIDILANEERDFKDRAIKNLKRSGI